MRIAVALELESTGLQAVISDLNNKQDVYDLVISPKSDSPVNLTIGEDYDGILIFDRVMMLGNAPKYNHYLRTYRNSKLSDQAMIIDFELDGEGRINFPFIQVAAENSERQKLLMEIGLMALANLSLMQNKEFMEYYFRVDAIVTDEGPIGSPSDLEEVSRRRQEIIVGCFLTGK